MHDGDAVAFCTPFYRLEMRFSLFLSLKFTVQFQAVGNVDEFIELKASITCVQISDRSGLSNQKASKAKQITHYVNG